MLMWDFLVTAISASDSTRNSCLHQIRIFPGSQMTLQLYLQSCSIVNFNKKVLLRDHKRRRAHGISCLWCALSWGTLSWSWLGEGGGTPVLGLDWGTLSRTWDRTNDIKGHPLPLPQKRTWDQRSGVSPSSWRWPGTRDQGRALGPEAMGLQPPAPSGLTNKPRTLPSLVPRTRAVNILESCFILFLWWSIKWHLAATFLLMKSLLQME